MQSAVPIVCVIGTPTSESHGSNGRLDESAYAGPVFGEPFAAFLRARRGALPKLAEAVRAYDPARNVAGAAFRTEHYVVRNRRQPRSACG